MVDMFIACEEGLTLGVKSKLREKYEKLPTVSGYRRGKLALSSGDPSFKVGTDGSYDIFLDRGDNEERLLGKVMVYEEEEAGGEVIVHNLNGSDQPEKLLEGEAPQCKTAAKINDLNGTAYVYIAPDDVELPESYLPEELMG